MILLFLIFLAVNAAIVALAICKAAAVGDRAMVEYFQQTPLFFVPQAGDLPEGKDRGEKHSTAETPLQEESV